MTSPRYRSDAATVRYSVAEHFSRYPAGARVVDGPHSGDLLRNELARLLAQGQLLVDLDGTLGFGSSFLAAAFGGLRVAFSVAQLEARLTIRSAADPSLAAEAWGYIRNVLPGGSPALAAASLEYSGDASARAVSDLASVEPVEIKPARYVGYNPGAAPGPLNQCGHEQMSECHPGCGHWHCPRCGLDWDDAAEGDW